MRRGSARKGSALVGLGKVKVDGSKVARSALAVFERRRCVPEAKFELLGREIEVGFRKQVAVGKNEIFS